jgi:hypothetical protein
MMNGRAFAQQLVQRLGGRFSSELGLDLDRRPGDIERWFLAATLFGNRISASIAVRTYRTLARAGVRTVPDVHQRSWRPAPAHQPALGQAAPRAAAAAAHHGLPHLPGSLHRDPLPDRQGSPPGPRWRVLAYNEWLGAFSACSTPSD